MEKIYRLNECDLQVFYNDKIIRIGHPEELNRYLSTDLENRTEVLVELIKQDYLSIVGREFNIQNDSVIVEICGHVYASHFAKALQNLIDLKLIDQMADFIIKKSDFIDCGERDVDGNRFFWDILANFKGVIVTFLPKQFKS